MDDSITIFKDFWYPETKDLTVKFLTLVSSLFAFSVVFAEKVIIMHPPIGKRHIPIIIAWVLFSCSLVLGGYGLWRVFCLAELVYFHHIEFRYYTGPIYRILNPAGWCFAAGLIMLAISALLKAPNLKRLQTGNQLPNKTEQHWRVQRINQ